MTLRDIITVTASATVLLVGTNGGIIEYSNDTGVAKNKAGSVFNPSNWIPKFW